MGEIFILLLLVCCGIVVWGYVNAKGAGKINKAVKIEESEPKRKVLLKDMSDREEVLSVNMGTKLVIGSDRKESHLIIEEDINVASKHCYLLLEDDGVYIQTIAKGCRIYINGMRVEGQEMIHPFDKVQIGNTLLQITAIQEVGSEVTD